MTSNFKELPSILLFSIMSSKSCFSFHCSATWSPSCQLSSSSSFSICEQSHLCIGFLSFQGHPLRASSSFFNYLMFLLPLFAFFRILLLLPPRFSSVLLPGSRPPLCPGGALGSFCSLHSCLSFPLSTMKVTALCGLDSKSSITFVFEIFFLSGYCRR